MKIIIKNGTVIRPYVSINKVEDLYLRDGILSESFIPDENTVIFDARDKTVIPGLVDIHVHFRDPGLTHKEDIVSGSLAAARGGFTTVCCMPNTLPPVDSVETLEYIDKKGAMCGSVNVLSLSAMTIGQDGKVLCDFEALDKTVTTSTKLTGHGICGISEDGKTLRNAALMGEVCQIANELDLIITDHAEPETQIVARDIELSKKYGCRIHIQHISREESIQLVREAKADGIKVTSEATPHHFTLDKRITDFHGSDSKMNPPLGNIKDRVAVLEGLLDDTIDIIVTDHAPHTEKEKKVPFNNAPYGVVGLETSFPVSYTVLVKSGLMSINKLIQKMSTKPLEIIGAGSQYLAVNANYDLAVIDTTHDYTINRNSFLSKSKNTPFHGMKVYGKTEMTIHNGKITWGEKN